MVKLVQHDLEFILKQIKVAEAHSAAIDAGDTPAEIAAKLATLVNGAGGTPGGVQGQAQAGLMPFGLRTVDGSFNNFMPGGEMLGSSSQLMDRLLDPVYRPAEGSPAGLHAPGTPAGAPTSYTQPNGIVYDSQPRVISNLIADQTLKNPAALMAALAVEGITGGPALAIVQQVQSLLAAAEAAHDAVADAAAAADGAVAAAQLIVDAAQASEASAQSTYDLAVAAEATAETNLAAAQQALQEAIAARDLQAGDVTAAQDAAAATLAARTTAQDDATATEAAKTLRFAELASAEANAQTALQAFQADPSLANATAYAAADEARDDAALAYDLAVDADQAADEALVAAQATHANALSALQAAIATQATLAAAVTSAQATLSGAELTLAQATATLTSATTALAAAEAALADALADLAAIPTGTAATAAAEAAAEAADQAVIDLVTSHGVQMDGINVLVPNVSADLGDTAPYNGFFTIFGQFFDHGLDLTTKGGSGQVLIPLHPDDPLYGQGATNFMVLTRATNQPGPDGVLGTADDIRENGNETTPWIDLNQVYTSNASHQTFLREYASVNGRAVATGDMLEGGAGGPPTWADVKAQALTMLGIELKDADVHSVPLLATDLYGEFVRGPNGFAMATIGVTFTVGTTVTRTVFVKEGHAGGLHPSELTPADLAAAGITVPAGATVAFSFASAGRAFLNDIAHNAVPTSGTGAALPDDADATTGNAVAVGTRANNLEYDDELLDRHFIVGDGRGNENIALTSIHTVFHGEHNRQVAEIKATVLASNDLAFINEWLLDGHKLTTLPADGAALVWDGERLFQASRFSTEMVYQHLVFEEFARAVAPQIDAFLFSNTIDIDPAISQEFAQVVYRFGHSMLNEKVDVFGIGGDAAMRDDPGLIEAFLNPVLFESYGTGAEEAAGAILRGMGRQRGNEIDEFMTDALRNNLVGLPLDLAALNMARARETGIPSLNDARAQFYAQTNDTYLKPYESWTDFAHNIKNPLSVVNFIAAYGTHSTITGATTAEAKRDAAMKLVLGGAGAPADRLDFLNATGAYAGGKLGGLNDVDFWIGGLAEAKMAFGGMLGSTFTLVFENQMERLQEGDRFYYLSRVQGLNLLNELEADSFAELLRRTTDTEHSGLHVNGASFQTADFILEMDQSKQWNAGLGTADPTANDPILGGMLSGGNSLVQRGPGSITFLGDQHVVIGGTNGNDKITGGSGDDTLWGEGGDDDLEGGFGVDHIFGGTGDDLITDRGSDIGEFDVIHGDEGNDVINPGMGIDLVFGGEGQDFIFGGGEDKHISGGLGNDFIRGGEGFGFLLGNEGDDWLEGGDSFDTLAGENSELFFNSTIIGHDVLNGRGNDNDYDGESGDDIMFQGSGIQRNNGMAGFDWAIHKGDATAANSDMNISIFTNQQNNILRDRFDLVEGLSGWNGNDTLTGRDVVIGAYDANGNGTQIDPTAPLDSYSNALLAKNLGLVDGLAELTNHLTRTTVTAAGKTETIVMDTADAGDILLGGGGSDVIRGMGGNDIIDGDKWLNVRIQFTLSSGPNAGTYTADGLGEKVWLLADYNDGAPRSGAVAAFGGKTLDQLMFSRTVNPGVLEIVREIVDGGGANEVDTAVYWDLRANYLITGNADGSVTVEHVNPTIGVVDPTTGKNLEADGVDRLWNVEQLRFADQTVTLVRPQLLLDGFDPGATYTENFSSTSYTENDGSWTQDWVETGDDNNSTSANGQIRITNGTLEFDQGNGATITRAVNLSGAAEARLTYSVAEAGFDAGETVEVLFAANGTDFNRIDLIDGDTNGANRDIQLTGPFSTNAAIRFVVSGVSATNETVRIDNIVFQGFATAATRSVDHVISYTEGNTPQSIGSLPDIVSPDANIVSARIVLTNPQAGDNLTVGSLNGTGITQTSTLIAGQRVITLTGAADPAVYERVIQSIIFSNTTDNPGSVQRIVEVTVNNGLLNSAVATTTITVQPIDDPANANNDVVYTNVARGSPIIIPEWVLLANDTDPDSPLDVTAVFNANGVGGLSLTTNPGSVTVTDPTTGASGGSFGYTANNSDNASVTITNGTGQTLSGGTSADILIGNASGTTLDAGTGNDIVLAGAGNDTIVWNANTAAGNSLNGSDGRDYVDGGTGTDTFIINGNNNSEVYRLYTRVEAEAAGIGGLKPDTEIVITRGGTTSANIIAELDNIEEIAINTFGGNGDQILVIGNFTQTSLALNTITIDGGAGDDTVDISSLTSAHRIVFRSNGGNDTIVGALRPQDVIELPAGTTIADYAVETDDDGATTLTGADGRTISFVAPNGMPGFGGLPPHEDEDDDDDHGQGGGHDDDGHGQDDDDDDDCDDDDDVGAGPGTGSGSGAGNGNGSGTDTGGGSVTPPPTTPTPTTPSVPPVVVIGGTTPGEIIGTNGADILVGRAVADTIIGLGGDDKISAGDGEDAVFGGDGDDVIHAHGNQDEVFGGAGNDRIDAGWGHDTVYGEDGDDVLTGAEGNDKLFGGDGDDLFLATVGDEADTYWGGEGIDTIDYAALTEALTINLGNGLNERGSVTTAAGVRDVIYSIENAIGGGGNDTIIASDAVNLLDGGDGNDTFRFLSATSANGDTIVNFQPGDRIDISAIDANVSASGKQSFSMASGTTFTAAGQITFEHVTREDGEFTIVRGNVDADSAAEFEFGLKGRLNLTDDDFIGLN